MVYREVTGLCVQHPLTCLAQALALLSSMQPTMGPYPSSLSSRHHRADSSDRAEPLLVCSGNGAVRTCVVPIVLLTALTEESPPGRCLPRH